MFFLYATGIKNILKLMFASFSANTMNTAMINLPLLAYNTNVLLSQSSLFEQEN